MSNQALNDEIVNLEQRELALLGERGRYAEGTEEWRKVDDELNAVLNKLSEKRAALDQEAQHKEELIQKSVEESAYQLDNLEVEGLRMRDMCMSEQHYNFLRAAVQQLFVNRDARQDEKHRIMKATYDDQLRGAEDGRAQLQRQNDLLQRKHSETSVLLNEALDKNKQIMIERNDFEQRLQNAAAEIEEWKNRYRMKDEELDRARIEYAVGAREAHKVIDQADRLTELRDLAEQIKAGKIRVVNMRPLDNLGTKYGAEDAFTGETYEFGFLEKGKYLELTDPNEVEQFRQQRATELSQSHQANPPLGELSSLDIPPLPAAVSGEQFRQEDVPTGTPADVPDMVESSTTEADRGLGGPVSREEYESFRRSTLRHIWEIRGSLESRGMLESREPADSGDKQQGQVA